MSDLRGSDFSAPMWSAGRAVLNIAALARGFWANEDPIGKHLTLTFFPPRRFSRVSAIVGDVTLDPWIKPRPVATIYHPLARHRSRSSAWRPSFGMSLTVLTSSSRGTPFPLDCRTASWDPNSRYGRDEHELP